MAELKVLGICGSLRRGSTNMMALRQCAELMPAGMALSIAEVGDIPLYNQDVYDAGLPPAAARFRQAVAAADALLLASPEYNFSVAAPLKNAIDWGSRAPNQVFNEKPVAILSCTGGPLGGARGQYDLRKILAGLGAHLLAKPEIFIGMAPTKFDAQGKLTDEPTRKILSDMLAGFKAWIERIQRSR